MGASWLLARPNPGPNHVRVVGTIQQRPRLRMLLSHVSTLYLTPEACADEKGLWRPDAVKLKGERQPAPIA